MLALFLKDWLHCKDGKRPSQRGHNSGGNLGCGGAACASIVHGC